MMMILDDDYDDDDDGTDLSCCWVHNADFDPLTTTATLPCIAITPIAVFVVHMYVKLSHTG